MSEKPKPEDHFTQMAARLARNPDEFAGAYVIVAPDGSVISTAIINPEGDEASFWGFVSSAVQIAGTEAQTKLEGQFGMQGRQRPR